MSVWELYTQLFVRNWRCGRFAWSLSQGCSEKIRKEDVVKTAGRWSNWSIQIPQFLMLWWPAMKAGPTAMTQRPRDRVSSGSMLALPDPRMPDRANPPTNYWWSLFWQYWYNLHVLGSHWTDCQQGILCWCFKEVQEEIPWEEATALQIGSVAFPPGQCTSPQLLLVTDYLTKMGIKTAPNSPDLVHCDFCLFPKLRGGCYETTEEMKEAVTKVIDMLTQEDFHGAFQKLFEWYNECIAARGDNRITINSTHLYKPKVTWLPPWKS